VARLACADEGAVPETIKIATMSAVMVDLGGLGDFFAL
jgi:hypothetical protein